MRLAVVGTVALILITVFFYATSDRDSDISVSNATASFADDQETSLRVFFQVKNQGGPDVLLSAESSYAKSVSIVQPEAFAALLVAIPANSVPVFSADGTYVELTGLQSGLSAGALVPVTLSFQEAGEIRFKAVVSDDSRMAMSHSEHVAGVVNDDQPIPEVSLFVEPSLSDSGWQVRVSTENFAFVNLSADAPDVYGEGHAHLYLNGLKLQRLYDDAAFIGALPSGKHAVSVVLNSNQHSVYLAKNQAVSAMVDIISK